ncbi:hypothetical protein [Chitinophaga arvensicola]|uniref:Uncharacterized protein n=1 Tax=Chitinophaga arvensicola TaxID=29529 RepID=A0A1I0S655_9BACT|nr:hypothetical protein [Chitinophaga arvensicola]SEW50493.1 hypothetical protein SAMN04488122_3843 [Chitinophaga arvensicola]
MKLFRHLFFVLIAVMILPQAQGHSTLVQKKVLADIHAANNGVTFQAAVKSPRFRATVNRFKRRPVGINDSYGHEKVSPVLLDAVTASFIYVDKTIGGYYFNPYLSVPTPLRSWRGPPTA